LLGELDKRRFARLAYVSDLPLQRAGGGSFVVNWHAHERLSRRFTVDTLEPVRPRVVFAEKAVSKLLRVLGRPGHFAYFSERTLADNATRVARALPADVDAVFFRSATRWCRCRLDVPYFVYLDVVFLSFFQNTFREADFAASDLQRIRDAEAAFLEGAAAVFFESDWGMREAMRLNRLRGSHYHAVGRGGGIDPPEADRWDGRSLVLVTMAMRFRQKGGDRVLEAYRRLKPRYPELRWHIVGGPPEGLEPGDEDIQYEGRLRPDVPGELARLRSLLASAFLLVHPTREDTSPLVLTEAAYFGCPAVSVQQFAIPELVEDGCSGLLLEPPVTEAALAEAIESLLCDPVRYRAMRRAAGAQALERWTWDRVGDRMGAVIERRLREAGDDPGESPCPPDMMHANV
jgi:glycosyltransferase involved in cell wall biosynthesis